MPLGGMVLPEEVLADLKRHTFGLEPEMISLRRDLHRHPEASHAEFRTTRLVADRLTEAGLEPRFPTGTTGLVCDLPGGDPALPAVALRADLDALPVADEKTTEYRSTVPGHCHACGHDVHTVSVLGAGLALARIAKSHGLPVPVRLVFQPAEEVIAGATLMLNAGALDGVGRIFGLHCDPRIEVGKIGLRVGALTSACDLLTLKVSASGARQAPGDTAAGEYGGVLDAVAHPAEIPYALAVMAAHLPALLKQRLDPRSGLSFVWGHIEAGPPGTTGPSGPTGPSGLSGTAAPGVGLVEGTIRCVNEEAWAAVPDLVHSAVEHLSATLGVTTDIVHKRGVPPLMNEASSIALMRAAADGVLGAGAVTTTEQSLGGEDFAWFVRRVPGAMARLGVATPGTDQPLDLHQGSFDADERAIGIAMRLLAGTALLSGAPPALGGGTPAAAGGKALPPV